MTDVGRRRFVQGALGTTAFLALPGRLIAWPQRPRRPRPSPTATRRSSPASRTCSTAATGTPTSGATSPASSSRTSRSWRRPAATPSRSASSPGRRSSPRRGASRSAGSTRSWTASRSAASTPSSPPRAGPSRAGCRRSTRRCGGSTRRAGASSHGSRHNHCFTSPVYREKVRLVNTKLAERYKGHKALARLAHLERVQRRLLLQLLPGRVPRLPEDALRRPRRAQPGLLVGVLGPDVPDVGPDRPARVADGRAQPRLGPLRHAPDRGLHEGRDRPAEGGDARAAGHHQHDGASSAASTTGASSRSATGWRGTPTRSCAAGATWRASR